MTHLHITKYIQLNKQLHSGTAFTISDLVESSTDPRSPLKLVARCRLYKIPGKSAFVLFYDMNCCVQY